MNKIAFYATVDGRDARGAFAAKGYALFRQLLSPEEVARYRSQLDAMAADQREPADFRRHPGAFAHIEGLTQRENFWPLIFHPRLLAAARSILGEQIGYVRHSDLHVNYPRDPKWHRDLEEPIEVLDRRLAESVVPFGILRAGIYLHDGMRFGIVPGSHRPRRRRSDRPVWWTNRVNRALMRVSRRVLFEPPIGRPDWLSLSAGDVLLFDIRVVHTGDHPRQPKYVIYLAYGLPNLHSVLHEAQFVAKPEIGGAPIPAGLRARLAEAGLTLARADECAAAPAMPRRSDNEAVSLLQQPG